MADLSKIEAVDAETGVRALYDIKDAVARAGIGDLTALNTTNQSDLVSAINEVAESAGGGDCGITYIESNDTENPVVLRELASGTYVLQGKFRPHPGSTRTLSFSSKLLVNIITKTAGTHVQVFYPVNNVVQFLNITDDAYERTDVNLNDLQASLETLENTVKFSEAQNLTDEQKAQARENIGANAKRTISDYEYPLEITEGKCRNINGKDADNSVYSYATVDVVTGREITIIGWQGASESGFYAYYFYDESGTCVEHYETTDTGVAVTATVIVPENAVKLVVNFQPAKNLARVFGESEQNLSTQDILDEVENQREELESITGYETTLQNYEYPLEITPGKLRNINGADRNDAQYEQTTVPVTPGDTIVITGYQAASASGFYLYYFYDALGACVAHYETTETGVTLTKTVVVPDGAVSLVVNGSPARCTISITGERTGKYGLDYAIETVETLRNKDAIRPKLITLGDSITALGVTERGWVGYFIEKTGCQLIANVAVSGATLHDKAGTVYDGNPVFQGDDNNVNNVLGNQVQKIINNNYEAPDIILIAIGTNGGGVQITKDDMTAVYYNADDSLIPLENVDRTTSAGAYRYALEKLHTLYPNAIIFWCTPIHAHQTIRTAEEISANAESLRIATDYTGQILIDTHRCGINGVNELSDANGEYLIDGLHPNINGAKKMGYYNASKVKPFLGNNFVEV